MSIQHSVKSMPKVPRNQGFALVATISIMALVMVLVVGMLSLTATATRDKTSGMAKMEARANATLALRLAVGELQKQLGPDQRISITADQRIEPGSDGSESSSADGNKYWTGVYNAWPSTSDSRPEPSFRGWLISGDKTNTVNVELSENPLDASGSIELVGEGTVGSITEDKVRVPALTVNGGQGGRLAWWIGDQGVKAAMNMEQPSGDTSRGVVRNNLQTAPRNAIEIVSTSAGEPFAEISAADERWSRIISWSQTSLLTSNSAAPQPLFHDLCAYSSGLLTNVRDGGFRKDLSMKLETYTSPPDLSEPENVLYTARSQMTGNEEVGINFMEIWEYYHLYKELKYGGGLNYTTGGSISADTPYLQTKRSQAEINADPWDRFKHPITINYQTIYSLEAAPHPDEGGKYVLWLNYDPVITLWNPLDVPVDIPRHTEDRKQLNYLYSYWTIPYDVNISINGGPEIKCSIAKSSNRKSDGNFLKLNAGVAETLTLKPGEVLKISQDGDISQPRRGQSVGGWEGFNGKKGFNYAGGFSVPLLTSESSFSDQNQMYRVVVSPNDIISYSVTPRAEVEAPNQKKFGFTFVWMQLGGRGQSFHGLMSIDNRTGFERVQVGEVRSRGDGVPNPLDVQGDEHPEVFPVIEGSTDTREIPVAALINDKAPFMVHTYFAKTEMENLSGSRMLSRFNPRAYSVNFYNLSKAERDMMPFESTAIGLTSWLNAPLDESLTGQGYFGTSLGAEFGSNYVTTHTVPRQPIVSLGALQHSFANGFNMATKEMPCKPDRKPDMTNTLYPLEPQISHAIGNSLAPSVIPSHKTTHNAPNYPHPLADHSYLANRELWDDWFFSGIAPQPRPAFAVERDQRTVAERFFQGQDNLPTVRYSSDLGDKTPGELVDSLFSGSIPTEEAVRSVASHLRVDGMFNVNSTSVEAWKAVLASLKDVPIVVRNENGLESIAPKDGNSPVANIGAPRNTIIEDDAGLNPEEWDGRRVLTDEEMESLAMAIVREVRKRGPFLSLADFVNRRVGNDAELARAGAIQSALDSEAVSINDDQNSTRSVDTAVASRFEFPEAEEGPIHYGAPSIVKQGDILTPIAPILSARSDSFVIRAYGESVDDNGNLLARSWCEAIVERRRDFVDPSDIAETPVDALLSDVNKEFGRQFKIVSFRWLDESEI